LFYGAGGAVDDQARAAEMILDQPIGLAALGQVLGRVAAGVDEAADELAVAVQLGDGAQALLIEKSLESKRQDLALLFTTLSPSLSFEYLHRVQKHILSSIVPREHLVLGIAPPLQRRELWRFQAGILARCSTPLSAMYLRPPRTSRL